MTAAPRSSALTAGVQHQASFSDLCYFPHSDGFQLLLKIPPSAFIFSTLNNFISASSVALLLTVHNTGAGTALRRSKGSNLGTADAVFRVVMSC